MTIATLRRELEQRTAERDLARLELDRRAMNGAKAADGDMSSAAVLLAEVATELRRVSERLDQKEATLAQVTAGQRAAAPTETPPAHGMESGEGRFRAVAEGVPQLIWTSHDEGHWTYANQRWLTYTGQSEKETLGLGWMEAVHPDDRQPTLQAWHEATVAERPLLVEHRLRQADGGWRWFETQAMTSQNSTVAGGTWIGSCTDIHARRLAADMMKEAKAALEQELTQQQQELEDTEARFRAYFEISNEALFIVSGTVEAGFVHEEVNPPFEQLTGYTAEQCRNSRANQFMPAAAAGMFESNYRQCLMRGELLAFDVQVAFGSGQRMLRVTLVPTPGGAGGAHTLLGSVRDIGNR